MTLRVARHTNNIEALKEFYCAVLNLEVLGDFKDHEGYYGIFLGKNNLPWHLEFTSSAEKVSHHFNEDDALVFYPETAIENNKIIENIETLRIKRLKAKNPYWNRNGITIKDPDGFNVVVSPLKIVDK